MSSDDLANPRKGPAAGGIVVQAAPAPPEGYHVDEQRHLVVTDRMLADKTLRMFEAGAKLPDSIADRFRESSDPYKEVLALCRYLLLIVTHLGSDHPLVADHPLLVPPSEEPGAYCAGDGSQGGTGRLRDRVRRWLWSPVGG
jgi:hypothetical protein